jgi:hypothetical protein
MKKIVNFHSPDFLFPYTFQTSAQDLCIINTDICIKKETEILLPQFDLQFAKELDIALMYFYTF